MSTIAKENLDERIERIKKRNEEIEKKYREAEEDRLRALKENAMVETKPPKDDDWPRTHKYDKLDFTYDVKREKLEEMNNQKLAEEKKQKRDYKKFPEGEGPPPDPAYNFLADAERDGLIIQRPEKGKDKDSKQNGNNNKNKDQQRRGGPNAGSFRGRGGKANNSPKYQKQNSQPDYEQWRSEREKIDEARINRQKVGEGKWRREWDNDKLNSENEALLRPERATLGDAIVNAKKSPTHHQNNMTEKRGNITVSVSQTGEVKSVKLTSAPVIGTGRVGPRQVTKPQFSIQAVEKELIVAKAPQSPKPQHKAAHRSNTNPNINHNQNKNIIRRDGPTAPLNTNQIVANNNPANAVKIQPVPNPVKSQQAPPNPVKNTKPHKPKSPKPGVTIAPIVPTTLPIIPPAAISPLIADLSPERASELIKLDLSHKPEFAKKSVQDRLIRIRQATNSNEGAEIVGEAGEACEGTGEKSVDNNNTESDATLNTQAEKVSSETDAVTNESITSEKDEKSNDSTDVKVDGDESSASTESNTNDCDQSNVSATSAEVGVEEPIETCDKNTPESLVQVTSAAEAVAAN